MSYPDFPEKPRHVGGSSFYSPADQRRAWEAQLSGHDGADERRARGLALRRQHDQANGQLHQLLPFPWAPGIRRARYPLATDFPQSLPAVHIMLQAPAELRPAQGPLQQRRAGDWLCMAALDESTGELRYEPEPAPQWADGSGGPEAAYDQQPTCKNCLRWAQLLINGKS